MTEKIDIIKDRDYLNWTNAWSESEFSKASFTHLFAKGQLGVWFSDPSMLDLVSTIGLNTIQMRFGLGPNLGSDDEEEKFFQVFMYGIDGLGTRVTPYYGSKAIPPLLGDTTPHEVPDVIAQRWKELWEKAINNEDVGAADFTTNYGFLRGYSYDMRMVVDTLFPGPDIEANKINVYFGLHQYLGREANPTNPICTFGLILHSEIDKSNPDSEPKKGKKKAAAKEENVYYDLTTPCPPTC